jgi:N-dimethylarginine dimethylaminohydrolase
VQTLNIFMFNVYQHWDPLKVCLVGKSYSPEFYSFIETPKVRTVMERIARETEEDYQKLITKLEEFGVKVVRPKLTDNYRDYLDTKSGKIMIPPMTPRDYTIMLGKNCYFMPRDPTINQRRGWRYTQETWKNMRGDSWPVSTPEKLEEWPASIIAEWGNNPRWPKFDEPVTELDFDIRAGMVMEHNRRYSLPMSTAGMWDDLFSVLLEAGNPVYNIVPEELHGISSAMVARIGDDLFWGTDNFARDLNGSLDHLNQIEPGYKWHTVDTYGHADCTYCPIAPGLIISIEDAPMYAESFPGWKVVYLPGESWGKVKGFTDLKKKNAGKWWVPGEELNDDFTAFVNTWLTDWVGYVEESVFDVNMLIIDPKNVLCTGYNEEVFAACEAKGITLHQVPFRHRYFWDGGLHCVTADLHREGVKKNFF